MDVRFNGSKWLDLGACIGRNIPLFFARGSVHPRKDPIIKSIMIRSKCFQADYLHNGIDIVRMSVGLRIGSSGNK